MAINYENENSVKASPSFLASHTISPGAAHYVSYFLHTSLTKPLISLTALTKFIYSLHPRLATPLTHSQQSSFTRPLYQYQEVFVAIYFNFRFMKKHSFNNIPDIPRVTMIAVIELHFSYNRQFNAVSE